MRLVFVGALDMATSGSFIPFPQAGGAADVKGTTHWLDRLALDIG
jgi:hypothetical protein